MGLDGRVALVTGGSRGIGRAIAAALAEDGADVAVAYRRDADAAVEAVTAIEALGRRARAYAASVDDVEQCRSLVRVVEADFGPIGILVSCAGIASRGQTVVETDPAELDRLMRTHAFAAHHLCQAALPGMRTLDRGDIVMVSSVAARLLAANSAPYNMAKAALEALALGLAKEELRHGVHVNVVRPGLVVTDMGQRLIKAVAGVDEITSLDARYPWGRVCRPEDVAGVVRFLVSDNAGYVTGQIVECDSLGG